MNLDKLHIGQSGPAATSFRASERYGKGKQIGGGVGNAHRLDSSVVPSWDLHSDAESKPEIDASTASSPNSAMAEPYLQREKISHAESPGSVSSCLNRAIDFPVLTTISRPRAKSSNSLHFAFSPNVAKSPRRCPLLSTCSRWRNRERSATLYW